MIEVYHLKRPEEPGQDYFELVSGFNRAAQHIAAGRAWDAGQYEKVARVDTDDLETAYHVTNNVTRSWSLEPDPIVTVLPGTHGPRGLRSSMVGDIFVRDGEAFVVAFAGFQSIDLGSDDHYEALLPDGSRCEWDERLRTVGALRVRKGESE